MSGDARPTTPDPDPRLQRALVAIERSSQATVAAAARLDELLSGSGVEPDPAHVARECATMAEKSDVREEIARVLAHLQHARELLRAGGPVGRKLDFLVQELHREANTTASKGTRPSKVT